MITMRSNRKTCFKSRCHCEEPRRGDAAGCIPVAARSSKCVTAFQYEFPLPLWEGQGEGAGCTAFLIPPSLALPTRGREKRSSEVILSRQPRSYGDAPVARCALSFYRVSFTYEQKSSVFHLCECSRRSQPRDGPSYGGPHPGHADQSHSL